MCENPYTYCKEVKEIESLIEQIIYTYNDMVESDRTMCWVNIADIVSDLNTLLNRYNE